MERVIHAGKPGAQQQQLEAAVHQGRGAQRAADATSDGTHQKPRTAAEPPHEMRGQRGPEHGGEHHQRDRQRREGCVVRKECPRQPAQNDVDLQLRAEDRLGEKENRDVTPGAAVAVRSCQWTVRLLDAEQLDLEQ